MPDNLQCIAAGHGDKWEAFCLDLDLAVQGHSFEEVRQSLGTAIEMYLERAMEAPEPTRSQLLNRKAPFFVRLMWGLRLLRSTIFGQREHEGPIGFAASCHA
jgi:hypothetical protein